MFWSVIRVLARAWCFCLHCISVAVDLSVSYKVREIHLYHLHIDMSSKINRSVHHHAHYDMVSTYTGKSGSHKPNMKFPWNPWEFFAWKRNVQTSCDFDIVCMWISYNWNFARYLCELIYLMFHCCVMELSCKYHAICIQNSLQLYFLSKFENIICYILKR